MSSGFQRVLLPWKGDRTPCDIPEKCYVGLIEPRSVPVCDSPSHLVTKALENPIGAPSLRSSVRPNDRVLIVVTDATRNACERIVLPIILNQLNDAGVTDDAVTILVALGLHRPSSANMMVEKYGQEVISRIRVADHNAYDDACLCKLGRTPTHHIPVSVNRLAVRSDFVIATGGIEPHLFAGYSGGYKTVSIGAAGYETIAASHCRQMIDDPMVRYSELEENPFQTLVREAGRIINVDFVVNAVTDENGDPIAVYAGHPEEAHRAGAECARTVFEVEVATQADIAISSPGPAKERDLYQALRAAQPAVLNRPRLVVPGGVVIIPASCPDGIGPPGYLEGMREIQSREQLRAYADRMDVRPGGEVRMYLMAKVLSTTEIILAGCQIDDSVLKQLFLKSAPSAQAAVDMALQMKGDSARVAVLPRGYSTIPRLPGSDGIAGL